MIAERAFPCETAVDRPQPIPLGLAECLAITTMLFTSSTASCLVSRTGTDWHPVAIPGWAWINLIVLACAGATLERARRACVPQARIAWLQATIGLGLLFLAGQVYVWSCLSAAEAFMVTNAHAAFLVLISGVHGLHLVGGIVVLLRAATLPASLAACAIYWHTIGATWLLVLLVFSAI